MELSEKKKNYFILSANCPAANSRLARGLHKACPTARCPETKRLSLAVGKEQGRSTQAAALTARAPLQPVSSRGSHLTCAISKRRLPQRAYPWSRIPISTSPDPPSCLSILLRTCPGRGSDAAYGQSRCLHRVCGNRSQEGLAGGQAAGCRWRYRAERHVH